MRFPLKFLGVLCLSAAQLIAAEPPPPAVVVPPPIRWSTPPARPQPLLAHYTFRSKAMDVEVGYNLYLPPGYEAEKAARYPVLYWLHGMNQSESTDQYPIRLLDDAIKANAIKPMIVVYASGGQRTFYTDVPAEKVLPETAIIGELIPHIDATFRTSPTRDRRAIAGMSMGGFGALKLAFKHPGLFSSVTAFAPAVRDRATFAKDRADILERAFNNDLDSYESNHPATLLRKNLDDVKDKLPVSLFVGTRDYLLPGCRSLHQLMTELKVEHVYQEFADVAHNLKQYVEQTKETPFAFAAEHFK